MCEEQFRPISTSRRIWEAEEQVGGIIYFPTDCRAGIAGVLWIRNLAVA